MAKTHKRVLSLVLSLVMVLSLLPIQALAADPGAGSSQVSAEADGVVVNKEVTYGSDGYQLSLESYVTNEVTTTETTTPLDIVLVLDVSGSMDQNMVSYTYTSTGSKNWSYSDVMGWNNPTYYYKVGDQYYEVTGDYTRKGSFPNRYYEYWLEYDYNGGTQLGNTARSEDATLWTGELYTRGQTSSIQKIAALKTAVNGFIDQVATNALGSDGEAGTPDDVTHKISIVKFAGTKATTIGNDTYQDGWYSYNYTQIVKDLTDVSGNGATTLKNAVNDLEAAGATSVDYGLELAENVLAAPREGAKQVVIVFTDGEPNHGNDFDNEVAATAVNKAKDLKDDGVTVFTVGVFEYADPSDTNEDFNQYMHGVSSNYPYATARGYGISDDWDAYFNCTLGDRAENSNYYLAATNADDLNAVFSSIASSIGTSKVEATATTVLTDTLSEYFAFPEGFSGSSAKVYKVPVTGKTGDTYTWGTPVDITGQVSITVNGKNIQVNGFDYTENAVTKTTAADGTVTWSGAKLVLTFPIVPDKTANWGATGDYATNSVAPGSQAGLTGYTVGENPGSLTLDNSTGTGEDGSPVAPVSTYQVKYTWSGLPKDETLYNDAGVVTAPVLPTDNGYYIEGKTYTVDPTEYPVLYTHDEHGNKTGKYTFSGWDKTGTQTMGDADVTISGTWTKTDIQVEQATITFVVETGGKTPGTTTDSGAINRPFPSRPDTPADTGYTFDGWYDAAGNEVTTWPEKVTESATYTAKFSRNQFTVTWMNGGETLETDKGVLYGTAPSYDKATPTKASTDSTDYTFAGWSEDPNATAAEAKQVSELPAVTKDVTYYAIFSESARQYDITVNYKSDDGKTLKDAYTASAGYGSGYDVTEQILASIEYQGTNYAKDTVTGEIKGTVQGKVEITVIYSVDEIGVEDPDQPDTVPDKYQKKVTFDVVNGAWNDGTEVQKEAVVTLYAADGTTWDKNGTGYLRAEQIPAAGEKPDIGYQEGSWGDTTPTIKLEITADRSFTYTYAPAENTAYTVKHYLENLDGTGYELADTETKYGTTGTTVNAEDKDYPGFTYDSTVPGTVTRGTIAADGSLVLKLYYTRNSYLVKYQYTGTVPSGASELPETVSYKYGATVTVAAAATAQGYTFSGWSKTGTFTMPAEPVTITGSFTAKEYNLTIKHVFTDDTSAPPANSSDVAFGSTVTANALSASATKGYTVSVAVEPQAASLTVAADQRSVTGTMPASDVTITFTYTPITVTLGDDAQIVKVDGEGQALNGAAFTFGGATLTANGNIFSLEGKTVTYGQTYTITETAPVGYTGVEPFQVKLNSDGESLKLVGSNSDVSINGFAITVTNRINQYDLKVEHVYKGGPKNGDAVIPATEQEYAYGASVSEAAITGSPLDAGYVFSDYVVVYHTAVAETLEEGQAAITGTMPASDVTITFNYAPRTDLSYTVNYLEKDTNAVLAQAKTVDGQTAYATVTEDSIAIAGYTVVAGQESQDLTISPEGENVITFYYTANTNTAYTVEHYQENLAGDGYTLADTENLTGTTGETATATSKTFEGFTFDADNASNVTRGTIAADGSLVLKLYYTRNSYEVKYQYTGDVPAYASGLPVTMLYKYGAEVTVAAAATATGYTFSGWSTKDAAISWSSDDAAIRTGTFTMPAKDVTFTGSFSQVGYKVIYDLNDGVVAEGTELTYSDLAIFSETPTIPNPYKEGFDFIGWLTADGDKWSPVVTGDVTYVAQYKEIGDEYDVIYKVDDQEVMRFTYTEGQNVFVEEPWTGASEWKTDDVTVNNDLFTMPGHDVVFTATTQATADTTYQVITHYVDRNGYEVGNETGEVTLAQIGTPVSDLDIAAEKTTYQGEQFLLDKVILNGKAVNGTETLAEGKNVIDIYYDIDAIGEENPDGPDGEPDKNQVIFTYESADPGMGTVNLSKVVVTKVNGLATAPQATATPNTDYAFVKWTESSYGMESTYADMSGLPLQHSVDTTFTAYFEKEGDPNPGPDPDPINVYFFAENGLFADGTEYYVTTVTASADGNYYLTAENLLVATANSGYQLVGTWKKNHQSANAPQVGDAVAADDMFVVTFAPEVVEPQSYTVTYQWKGNAPAGVTPPAAETVPAGAPYGIKNPSLISLEDENGYWTFLGWKDDMGTAYMGQVDLTGSLTLYGTWDLQAKPEVEPQPPQQNERFFVTKNAMESVVTAGDTIHWIITIGNLTDEAITLTVTDPLPGVVVTDETGAVVTTVTVPAQYHVILNASYVTTDADAHNTIYNTVVVSDGTEEDSDKSTGTKVEPQYFSVTWQNYDGTVLELDPQVEKGTMPVYNGSTPTRPSDMYYVYTFVGWTPTVSPVTGNVVYTATYQEMYIPPYIPPTDPGTDIDDPDVPLADLPGLNTVDHYAYIAGYEDGTVRPNNNITRAEVATIFFRLFTDEYRETYWSTNNPFSDVAYTAWYNNAVSTTSNAGIIAGYPDGTFQPNNYITRAEFATIAARFLSEEYVGPDLFTDISGHWAAEYINRAANAGWINGYPDGSFRPNAYITRAEAMTLVNSMLGRMPHKDHMLENMVKWPDNPEAAWYYEAVQEATNGHDYDWYEEEDQLFYEIWTALQPNRDWAALEKEWSNAYSAPGGEVIG